MLKRRAYTELKAQSSTAMPLIYRVHKHASNLLSENSIRRESYCKFFSARAICTRQHGPDPDPQISIRFAMLHRRTVTASVPDIARGEMYTRSVYVYALCRLALRNQRKLRRILNVPA